MPRRFYCYHDYKLHLPSIEDAHTRYSFVVNAFEAARDCGFEYDKLAELTNICGHVSAQKPLAGEWCVAIQELCAISFGTGYPHLADKINVSSAGVLRFQNVGLPRWRTTRRTIRYRRSFCFWRRNTALARMR